MRCLVARGRRWGEGGAVRVGWLRRPGSGSVMASGIAGSKW